LRIELGGLGPAAESRIAALRAKIAAEQKGFDTLITESRALRSDLESNKLTYRLSSGSGPWRPETSFSSTAQNQLNLLGKLGVSSAITSRESQPPNHGKPTRRAAASSSDLRDVRHDHPSRGPGHSVRSHRRDLSGNTPRRVLYVPRRPDLHQQLAGLPWIVLGSSAWGFFVYGMGSFIDGGAKVPLAPVWWLMAARFHLAFIGLYHPCRAVFLRRRPSRPE